MTTFTDDDYRQYIDKLCGQIATDPSVWTAAKLVDQLAIPHAENDRVFKAATNACKITMLQIEKAIKDRTKKETLAAAAAKHSQTLRQRFNLEEDTPITARTIIAGGLMHYNMSYGRVFTGPDNKKIDIDKLLSKLQLDAEEYGLLEKPYELRDKSLERALIENVEERRTIRKEEVWQQIAAIHGEWQGKPRNAKELEKHLLKICKHWLKTESGFAAAAIKKVIWQIKRKMRGLRIKAHHVVVLYGGQDSGKSYFWSLLRAVMQDLAKMMDVDEVVSESQLDLFTYFLIDLDEMAKADRADLAKFKSLITKPTVSRRVYYTQMLKDIEMSAVLVGSSNTPVKQLIPDPTGMRRFIQLDVKARADIEHRFWMDEIEGADWVGMFQLVDETGPDPMDEYLDELRNQQEGMRSKGRVEQWLEQYEWHRSHKTTPGSKPPTLSQYAATELYKLYRRWDEEYCTGKAMTMGNWGVQMKTLIEDGRAEGWIVYEAASNRTFYTHKGSNVVPLALPENSSKDEAVNE